MVYLYYWGDVREATAMAGAGQCAAPGGGHRQESGPQGGTAHWGRGAGRSTLPGGRGRQEETSRSKSLQEQE